MARSDAAAVDAAIVAQLQDATLAALVPDGVWVEISPPQATRFVIVQLMAHEDTDGFDTARLYERSIYLVKAVILASTIADANAAAARIDQLLHDQPLVIEGFAHMSTLRLSRLERTEVDSADADIRWIVRGGQYEIFVSPNE